MTRRMGKYQILLARGFWVAVSVLVAGIVLLTATASMNPIRQTVGSDAIVATVNGVPVEVSEFKQQIAAERAGVFNYFHKKYGVEDGADFWVTSHDGEVPLEMIKQRALDAEVKVKVQQIVMQEKGIVADISYATFLRNLADENARRKAAIQKKEPIYGPIQVGEHDYFAYLMSNAVIKLKQVLAEKELDATEAKLKAFYEVSVKGSDQGNATYDDQKAQVKQRYVDEKYAAYVDDLIRHANVEVQERVYADVDVKS
ncbi:hypothetical protein A8709_05100 [Paenibacillus pectinilyticus]|uniref:Uncharacterized protein n=1 Tax=Paenibacillus pectinilyticus TaxID=512399 RepID=A0A1C0ZSL7_9BACL|nr:hypothetical protein [Paenibacillus pectinilyticus]OCT11075.1 hypothetical protein A8709_05100 [Paenibacillus pectinilyticus]